MTSTQFTPLVCYGRKSHGRDSLVAMTLLVVLLLIVFPRIPAAQAQYYPITPIELPPNPYTTYEIYPQAINDDSQVAGCERHFGYWWVYSAFRWDAASGYAGLGSLSSDLFMHDAGAYGINNTGQVVGASHYSSSGSMHAFLWTPGGTDGTGWNPQMKDIATLGGDSVALGVNDVGQVVGRTRTVEGEDHAFLYTAGGMIDLASFGSTWSEARAINNAGWITGCYQTSDGLQHAFLWNQGVTTDLGHLGGNPSSANDINSLGQVVGSSSVGNREHAVLWRNGAMHDLGVLPNRSNSVASAINDLGQVVGHSDGHAFIYSQGTMKDLNNLIPPDSGWVLETATDINNRGQIVGYSGSGRGFLLTPERPVQGINYADFSSIAGLNLVGDARQVGSDLRLNPASQITCGAAWFAQKQPIAQGFVTSFQFRISELGCGGADGFAFVIQNESGTTLPRGLGSLGAGGIPNSLAVEFDTWYNEEWQDPSANHISVQTRGTLPNICDHVYSLGCTSAIPDLSDGNVHTATIAYQPGTMAISVDGSVALSVPVNLANTLALDEGKAWVGFTGVTRAAYENHDILSWRLTPVAEPPRPATHVLCVGVRDELTVVGCGGTMEVRGDVAAQRVRDALAHFASVKSARVLPLTMNNTLVNNREYLIE